MKDKREVMPILPIRGGIIFPGQIVPITISSDKARALVEDVIDKIDARILVVAQKSDEKVAEKPEEIYNIGTIVKITKFFRDPQDNIRLLVEGIAPGRIVEVEQTEPYMKGLVEEIELEQPDTKDPEVESLVRGIIRALREYVELSPLHTREHLDKIERASSSPIKLAHLVTSILTTKVEEKQKILEEMDPKEKLKKTLELIRKHIEMLRLSEKIQEKVREEFERTQKEYFLREQMKVIQKELGEEDTELEELEKKIETLPQHVKEVARRELNKLKRLQPISPEYHVVRTYLDWLVNMPWNVETQDNLDLKHARKVLDEDHYDLDKVKQRILEYLAVRKLKKDAKGAIMAFVGPPGVGKTSLGQSIARALGRKFIRISLGGIRDEAEIRGHRRTYVGALPGRIISAIRKVGVKNPVIMLDEVDKIGADFRGDPAAALLEVLDPEQNKEFTDHYLEVPFDLSKVIFIATANTTVTIPAPLLDRMEVIDIPGYTIEDKIHIAKRHLIPREIKNNGLEGYDIRFTEGAIRKIIEGYTREAGVRQLAREIASVLRKIALEIAEGTAKKKKFVITEKSVRKYLGPEKYYSEVAERKGEPGVVIGLAWTPTGGDIIFIEAIKMPGKGNFKLTGQLGDVMKESAEAAFSLLKANYKKWGIKDYKVFAENDVHVHVPAGAIPKDGPSAGISILMALISLFSERPPKPYLAMTGEITLRGKVLPVGGIKEKVLAAKRAGIKEIILPKWNKKDLEEIPKENIKDIKFHFVDHVNEAYRIVFEDA